jgi:hypothetical protein
MTMVAPPYVVDWFSARDASIEAFVQDTLAALCGPESEFSPTLRDWFDAWQAKKR